MSNIILTDHGKKRFRERVIGLDINSDEEIKDYLRRAIRNGDTRSAEGSKYFKQYDNYRFLFDKQGNAKVLITVLNKGVMIPSKYASDEDVLKNYEEFVRGNNRSPR